MKSTMIVKAVLVALCLGLSGLPLLMAQNPQKNHHGMHPFYKPPTVPPKIQALRDPKYWAEQRKEVKALTNDAWVYEQWTGDDGPYAAARLNIDHALATTPPQALVARYAAHAKSRPNDPLAQFSWAYTVHDAIKSASFPAQDAENTRFAAQLALAEAPFPRTYNYARLRYLIWIQGGGGGPSHFLKGMAYRLLQKDPNDFPVLSGLIQIYSANHDKAAQQQGYALIQKTIKKYPGNPQVYDLLGGWYYFQYLSYHNPSDYRSAMASYQKALGMYPPQSARRGGLPQVMAFLTTRYHQISAGGP